MDKVCIYMQEYLTFIYFYDNLLNLGISYIFLHFGKHYREFGHGLCYVALSRATDYEKLVIIGDFNLAKWRSMKHFQIPERLEVERLLSVK